MRGAMDILAKQGVCAYKEHTSVHRTIKIGTLGNMVEGMICLMEQGLTVTNL